MHCIVLCFIVSTIGYLTLLFFVIIFIYLGIRWSLQMFPKTLLTRLFRIENPLIQAPMSPLTTPELVANVSNAGGLGSIAGARMTGEQLRREIAQVRSMTDRPFAVNLFIPPPLYSISSENVNRVKQLLKTHKLVNCTIDVDALPVQSPKDLFPDQIKVVLDEKVSIFSFTFGCPSDEIIAQCKRLGIGLVGTATTVNEAVYLKKAGCDAVCLQGSEAGGHRGSFLTSDEDTIEQSTVGLQSLLSQTAQFIDPTSFPLIAAGGIMDGQGVASAVISGASGVQLGTRFLTCDESVKLVPEAHRRLLLEAKTDVSKLRPTVLTRAYTGKPARGIRTSITDLFQTNKNDGGLILPWQIQSQLVLPLCKFAADTQQVDFMQLWAGQNYAQCESQSAASIVEKIIRQTRALLVR